MNSIRALPCSWLPWKTLLFSLWVALVVMGLPDFWEKLLGSDSFFNNCYTRLPFLVCAAFLAVFLCELKYLAENQCVVGRDRESKTPFLVSGVGTYMLIRGGRYMRTSVLSANNDRDDYVLPFRVPITQNLRCHFQGKHKTAIACTVRATFQITPDIFPKKNVTEQRVLGRFNEILAEQRLQESSFTDDQERERLANALGHILTTEYGLEYINIEFVDINVEMGIEVRFRRLEKKYERLTAFIMTQLSDRNSIFQRTDNTNNSKEVSTTKEQV